MPLPWYQIPSDFSRRPDVAELCGLVDDPNAGMYVVRLREHCAEHALDGRIRAASVEGVAAWRGKRGELLKALQAAGVLDGDGETRTVRGWEETNGARIRKWLADARKPRGNKPRPATVPPASPAGPPRDLGGNSGGNSDGPGGVDVRRKKKKPAGLLAGEHEPPGPAQPVEEPPPPTGIAAALGAPPEPGYVPLGFRKPEPIADDGLDDFPVRPPPVFIDERELPAPAARLRGELERQVGRVLALTGSEAFIAEAERLDGLDEGLALRVCVKAAEELLAREGEVPGSLEWFARAMAKHRGTPALGAPPPPPLPAPDPEWLATLPEDRRAKALAQWEMAEARIKRAAWPDRQRELLENELAGLVARFTEPPRVAAGGAS